MAVATAIEFSGLPQVQAALERMRLLGERPHAIFAAIGQYGETSTRERFKLGVGPDGQRWRVSQRVSKQGGQTLVLSTRLLRSITNNSGASFAEWGTNAIYARIHQLGGTIERLAQSRRVRLRTDAAGRLLRQGQEGRARHLAVFAKDSHKRVRESWSTSAAGKTTMPARPFLGVNEADGREIQAITLDVIRLSEAGRAR